MKIQQSFQSTRYILEPGDYYCSNQNIIISTILGSCVSACLFDPVNKIVAMNHFLLSSKKMSDKERLISTEAGRYGVHAMELIINGMLKLGAKKSLIQAKAFGGGNVLQSSYHQTDIFRIGEINIQFIKEFLETEQIPLIAADLGGEHGRVIRFFSDDFKVLVKKIGKVETSKIASKDQLLLAKVKKEQNRFSAKIHLWR